MGSGAPAETLGCFQRAPLRPPGNCIQADLPVYGYSVFASTAVLLSATLQDSNSCLTAYEDFKRSHLDTDRLCIEEGLAFAPVVFEASGGACGPTAAKILAELAKAKSIITGEPQDRVLTHLYQGLSIILHRENARARLKRLRSHAYGSEGLVAVAATLQSPSAAEES